MQLIRSDLAGNPVKSAVGLSPRSVLRFEVCVGCATRNVVLNFLRFVGMIDASKLTVQNLLDRNVLSKHQRYIDGWLYQIGRSVKLTRKNYRPQNARTMLPMSVEVQKHLIDKSEGETKALLELILSTGMHPKVLAEPKRYGLTWNDKYVSWRRTKTMKEISLPWSKAMREPGILEALFKLKGKTRVWYWMMIKELGRENGVTTLCPLQLRHNYFINRARLGHNAFDMAHGSATSLDIVYRHYTVGMNESKSLSDDDKHWLQWLMEA